jgi:membrane protein
MMIAGKQGTFGARLRLVGDFVARTLERFSRDRADLLAAALAFYALLSSAPLIIVAVGVAGIVLGHGEAQHEVSRLLRDNLGAQGAATVGQWVQQASANGGVASVVGLALTLVAASSFATQLRSALNQVWNIDVTASASFKSSIKDYLQRRIFAFGLTLAAGPVLLAVFTSRTLLFALRKWLFAGSAVLEVSLQVLQIGFSLGSVAAFSSLVFRYVPEARVPWKSALVGGTVTSVSFNIGNALVGFYLGRASVAAAYGAAGSLVVVLLWFYFSAQMFLLGAEFTRLYAERASQRPLAVSPLRKDSKRAGLD